MVFEWPNHRADVSRPHAHVAVSDDERVVLGVADEIGEVADFEIRADRTAVGHELQFETGKLMAEAVDDGHGGIVKVPDAEDDFKTAIILEAKTAEILVQLPVVTPQRLQYRDGRRNVRGRWPTSPVEHDGRKGREPIDGRKDHQAEKDEINHGRFTARPGCTSQSTGATTSAVLTGIARTSQYRDRRQLSGDRSLMPPIRDRTRRCRASRGVEAQNTDEAFWPTFRQGACRVSGLGQELYIGGARGEAVA